MKPETRNGYVKRYDTARNIVVLLIKECSEDQPELLEKYQSLFMQGKEVETYIYENENSAFVSNKLQSFENRVKNAADGIFGEVVDIELPEVEAGTTGAQVLEMLADAQRLLTDAYGLATQTNPLAAGALTVIMQDVSRVAGLLQ